MKRLICKAPWMTPALPLLLASVAIADGQATPSIRATMYRQYTVSRALLKIIRTQIDAQAPDWEKVQQAGEKFFALAETPAKITPRHDGEESWRHLVDQHTADAGAMVDAAEVRDLGPLAVSPPADRGIVQDLSRGAPVQAGKLRLAGFDRREVKSRTRPGR